MAIHKGPWLFRNQGVLIEEYDGFTKPSQIKLDTMEIWAQIHDLPDGFFPMLRALAGKIGEVVFVEPKSHDFEGNFYRVRVKIDVHKPLKNATSVVKENKGQIFLVKYERLPD